MKKIPFFVFLALALVVSLSACGVFAPSEDGAGPIRGSGHISAREVSVAPELSGKLVEINAAEGETVQAGDVLMRLDDQVYQAQYDQAVAAVGLAEAAVETAQAQLEAARLQYEVVLQAARLQEQPVRLASWQADQPDEFDLPAWYYEKDELIAAAQSEVALAEANLDTELANLERELAEASNADLLAVETRLAAAQASFTNAQLTLEQAQSAQEKDKLEEIAQEQLDAALSELEAAQLDYDRILSTNAYEDVLDARGRVALARTRYQNAQDALDQLRTGEDALQIEVAGAAVRQAETGVAQAEAALEQARSAAQVLAVQIAKTAVSSPASGVVLARNLEVGEVAAAGSAGLVIADLDEVELTVYIPEDRYGQVELGQAAEITVDSFPGETFQGVVVRIADEAEFTPRNVQTVDGRKSTVYAVVIRLPNPDWKLKPGMPADAVIEVEP